MHALPLGFDANTLHLGEFLPPLLAGGIYLPLYAKRALTLRREGRPVPALRVISFVSAVLVVVAIQLPPFDTIGDEVLLAHMTQHLIIGEIASLFIVLGLTGPVIAPLLHWRYTRPLRRLTNPVIALALWAINLYTWHLPFFYQLAIRHDLVHALEHASLLWFGVLLWMAVLGPLPKPAWFEGWGGVGYVTGVRFAGALLGNIFIWTQTVLYPVYRQGDARWGLNPVSDQNLAGGAMDIVQILITTLLVCWLFMRFAKRDEERQSLMDFAADRGIELSDERAKRAAIAGTGERLRERLLEEPSELPEHEEQPAR
jgi:cytochrome c oxidase assembly factor CtaG